MRQLRRIGALIVLAAIVAAGAVAAPGRARADDPFLPRPVVVAQEPQGVQLADPAFDALPGAKAYYGRLGGAVYEIEVPDHWNGRLVLYMHGFQGLSSHARVEQPSFRDYLIRNGFAWGATSTSSTSLIPGREADETAALWDEFARRFGRPKFTYVTGHSMGGGASNIAAERYGNRFDGALGMCGFAGQTAITNLVADYFVAGAYVAGVTQSEYQSSEIGPLIYGRILPALADPDNRTKFEYIMTDLTGGPRALDDAGFRLEEATNWERARILVAGQVASNEGRTYQLGPLETPLTADFNARALRLRATSPYLGQYNDGNELTGRLQMPLLTMHTTGDWQVPIDQQQTLRRIVDAAGSGDRLVQRVVRDEKHCGFTNAEWIQGFNDLMAWVEHDQKPARDDVMVRDLNDVGTTYTLTPRSGTPESWRLPHAFDRIAVTGTITLDGRPLNGGYVGVMVRRGRFATDCTYQLEPVFGGVYFRYVPGDAELAGCGGPGAKLYVWALVDGRGMLFSQQALDWPPPGTNVTFDVTMSRADPGGANGPSFAVFGDALDDHGQPLPAGTRIEARAASAVCASGDVAPVARVGYVTYVLIAVTPAPVGCSNGATLRFYIHGRPSRESLPLRFENGVSQLFINQAP